MKTPQCPPANRVKTKVKVQDLFSKIRKRSSVVNKVSGISLALGLIGWQPLAAQNTFTSLYVFGDGVCTTTDNMSSLSYFGNRFCNGPVWVEVLSEWQGLPYVEAHNDSFFGHVSGELLSTLTDPMDPDPFVTPADVATSLFVVWTSNADYVEFIFDTNTTPPPYGPGNIQEWTDFSNAVVTNHQTIINDLYTRGVRTLVIPEAVDFVAVPTFSLGPSDRAFVEARVLEFNAAMKSMLDTLLPTLPGLTVLLPKTFAFFEEILSNPNKFGATNTTIDAITDLFDAGDPSEPAFDGPGADYVFWDPFHPTARIQVFLADLFQQLISPPRITGVFAQSGQLEVTNAPVGRPGFILGTNDLIDWDLDVASFTSTGNVHTETVPTTDPERFFQVAFPVPEANLPMPPGE